MKTHHHLFRIALLALAALFAIASPPPLRGAAGDLDPSFTVSVNSSQNGYAVAVQPDGKVIVAGGFNGGGISSDSTYRLNIARYLPDGSLDTSFAPRVGPSPTSNRINCVAVQPDGKILIGGVFSRVESDNNGTGVDRTNLARLMPNGEVDNNFNTAVPSAPGASPFGVMAIAVQRDGKILVGGEFSQVTPSGQSSVPCSNLVRLESTGAVDTSWTVGTDGQVVTVAVLDDGRVVFGGYFSNAGGQQRRGVARASASGVLDSFDPNPAAQFFGGGAVLTIVPQADGKLLLGGAFNSFSKPSVFNFTCPNLARFNDDGTPDTGFVPQPDGDARSLGLQVDGKVIVGGTFTNVLPSPNTTLRRGMARFNADGSLEAFPSRLLTGSVYGAMLQADGSVLISGNFLAQQQLPGGGVETRNFFARLLNDAGSQSVQTQGPTTVFWRRSGALPEVSHVTFESSLDGGNTWTLLGSSNATRVGTTGNWQLTGLSLPSNAVPFKIRARGRVGDGRSSGLIEQVADITDLTAPTLSTVAMSTNNASNSGARVAKVGDSITLSITASEAIKKPTVSIAGRVVASDNVTGGGNSWTATITVENTDPQGPVSIAVGFADVFDNPGTQVTTLTGGATPVKIDRTAPTITVPADITVISPNVNGRTVTYSVSASDNITASPQIVGNPASGSFFVLGTTPVQITATDEAGNQSTASFNVEVQAAKVSLPQLAGGAVPAAGVTGSGVPTGAVWRLFGVPGLDDGDSGTPASVPFFRATFSTPTTDPRKPLLQTAVFGLGGASALLAKTGDPAPGSLAAPTSVGTFATLGEPVGLNGTAFTGTILDPNNKLVKAAGLWTNTASDADGTLRLVAGLGANAGTTGTQYLAIEDIALNSSRALLFTARLTGPAARARGLFWHQSFAQGAAVVLRNGDPAPGLTGVTVKSFVALREGGTGGLSGVTAGGGTGRANGTDAPVLATLSNGSVAVLSVGLPGGQVIVARTGTATPDIANATFRTLGVPAAADDALAFRAILAPVAKTTDVTKDNAAAIYLKAPGRTLSVLVRQGAVTWAGGNGTLRAFSDPVLDLAGNVAFYASIVETKSTGLFIARKNGSNYSLVKIAEVNGDAPDIAGVKIGSFTGLALPQDPTAATAGPVFAARLKSGTTKVKTSDDRALFACDTTGAPKLLVRTGSQVSGKTIRSIDAFSFVANSPAQARATASGSKVIYRATFTDRSQGILEIPLP